jgi:hypothetical protein
MGNHPRNKLEIKGIGKVDSPCPYDEFGRCGIRYSDETQGLLKEITVLMQQKADTGLIQKKFEILKGRLRQRFLKKYGDAARAEKEVAVDDKVVLIQMFLTK